MNALVRVACGFGLLLLLSGTPAAGSTFRSIDGTGNNVANPDWGSAETPLVRLRDVIEYPLPGFDYDTLAPSYEDGIDVPRGQSGPVVSPGWASSSLPNPRAISNVVVNQSSRSVTNHKRASDWLWQWGQFIDHDFALEEPTPLSDPLLIPVTDPSDSLYNADFPFLPFRRNDAAPGTGAGTSVPREQVNALTAYIDGSQVYGSDVDRADFLRTKVAGKLKTAVGLNGEVLLPLNRAVDPFPNANPPVLPTDTPPAADTLFLAGDVRANEQTGLTAVHTLFVREHNRVAEEIAMRSDLSQLVAGAGFSPRDAGEVDEFLYQTSRKVVGAQIQAITYNEFLPMLVGEGAIDAYSGYDETVDATLSNEFANAAYRVGHTLLSPQIQLVDQAGNNIGNLALRDAFFQPDFVKENGIESALKGLSTQEAQAVDALVIDEVRNFLFAEGNGGLDLAAVNIQRGRDHGLPSYNAMRQGLGLGAVSSFAEITSDAEIVARLEATYDSVDEIDLWLGAVAEDPVGEGLVGQLLSAIIVEQFTRLRDGDRFFYLNLEENADLVALYPDIGDTRLSEVILRNSTIESMPANAFAVPEPASWVVLCALVFLVGCGIASRGQLN